MELRHERLRGPRPEADIGERRLSGKDVPAEGDPERPSERSGFGTAHLTHLCYQCTKIHKDNRTAANRSAHRAAYAEGPQRAGESLDLSLGDLLEGIVLHAFEGKTPFSEETLKQIARLKEVYGLDLTAADAHALQEAPHGE